MQIPNNDFLRYLGKWDETEDHYQLPHIENGLLFTPDNLQWRISERPLSEIINVGDKIKTNYGTGGIVTGVEKFMTCCCPYRAKSRKKYCEESWDQPEKTNKYHIEVFTWSVYYASEDKIKIRKDGTISMKDNFFLNDFVFFQGRILHLFANNTDEIFIDESKSSGKTFQLSMSI